MRLSALVHKLAAFAVAGLLAYVTANYSVTLIEDRSEIGVRSVLDDRGLTWAEVSADGLQVNLAGIAPTEALRFSALTAAGSIVDAARVIDDMQVEAQAALMAPRFSAEILRNDAGVSIFGLVPTSEDRDAIGARFSKLAGSAEFADLLETADYPVPAGWGDAMSFAMSALDRLPRAKVSVEAGRVAIKAISESREEKAMLESALRRTAPPGLNVSLDISAPRPVLTPFTLRFVKDEDGTRFDACSADSEKARTQIIDAAFNAGLTGPGACIIGMGVPTQRWAEAAELGIAAVNEIGSGSVTFSDADITLLAPQGTDPALFDRVIGRLENRLPDVFALKAVLPKPDNPSEGPAEFVATLSPEGLVQLRGRLPDAATRSLATSYAQSLFGTDTVRTGARLAENLPADWSTRVLTALEALGNLSNGAAVVGPDTLSVSGNTGDPQANAQITQLLASKLGQGAQYDIRVVYQEKLDPTAGLPSPDECEAEIDAILEKRKITFEPGSATIDESALGTMTDIAEILRFCGDLKLEIQGHTDSQGRTSMNQELSQERAQSVLNELRARRVITTRFAARGYGESEPIADNGTEEGREANRRIEFRLIRPAPTAPEPETTLDSLAEQGIQSPEQPTGDAANE
ncbi:MAG: OmpA family protein [Paracoccaceae bacterium]